MKKSAMVIMAIALGLSLSSCNNTAETKQGTEAAVKTCLFSYDNASSSVGFTAYKFLSKKGVGGVFKEINVQGMQENEDAQKVIESLSFEIPIASLDTKDAGRDAKINKFFFETIQTAKITGKVLKLDSSKGEASLSITMNGISKDVSGKYSLEDGHFVFNTDINVADWNALPGIEALNKECAALHTDKANGEKEPKLWSDVTISFETTLKKECK